MQKKTFYLYSLGCAKNTVDSNVMAQILIRSGFQFEINPKKAQFLIVNTCGFIKPARDEAVESLNELDGIRKRGQFLLAVGCMAEKFSDEIRERCPGVDGILGTRSLRNILALIGSLDRSLMLKKTPGDIPEAAVAPQGPSAYLKIADGCSRNCAFCAIPLIKGKWQSRSVAEICRDAQELEKAGTREIILIAQDSTAYGRDRGESDALPGLIEKISAAAPAVSWIRILYAFPGIVSDRLIDLMAENERLLPYLDIPLQHADPQILKAMNRPDDVEWVRRTVEKLRRRVPGIAIRSTFITGFPGETDASFNTLLDFIEEMQFDRVGVFPYYQEAGTPSAALPDNVPADVKQARADQLMSIQQKISRKINRAFVGKTIDVLIEGQERGMYVGRSYRDAPEIDGFVFAEGVAEIGDIVPVRVHSALDYDLSGKIV